MGQAQRRKKRAEGEPGSKRNRMFHLLRLISRYSDYEIGRFVDRRFNEKGGEYATKPNYVRD